MMINPDFEEGAAVGRVRSELVNIQAALMKGAKRSAAARKQSWLAIAQEASNRAGAIIVGSDKEKAKKPARPAESPLI